MGAMKNLKQEKRDRKKSRRRVQNDPVSWTDIDPDIIVGLIRLVEEFDGAIRFGRSRDNAVYSIGFYLGDERFTEWIRNTPEIDMEFARLHDEIAEDFGGDPSVPE